MRLTKFALILVLFMACGFAFAQPAHIQGQAATQNGSATLSATLPSNLLATDMVVATAWSDGHVLPTGMSGCGVSNWRLAAADTFNAENVWATYYITNVSAISCTATVTYASGTGSNIIVDEYSGLPPAYALDISVGIPTINCCTSLSVTVQGSNELLYGIASYGPGAGSCTGASSFSIYSVRESVCGSPSSDVTSATFDSVQNAGTYVFNGYTGLVNSFGVNYGAAVVVFRSVIPNPGRVQQTNFTDSVSATYLQPNLAGDRLIAECEDTNSLPTDTLSQVWHPVVIPITSDSSNIYNYFTVDVAAAYSTGGVGVTVNCTGSPTNDGIRLWEYTPTFIGASTVYFTQNTSITSIPAGTVQADSNAILFSMGAIMENTGITFTASTGFVPITTGGNGDSLQMWERIVTPGNYSNTITPGGTSFFPQGTILVLESSKPTVPVLQERTRQSGSAGPDGSLTGGFIGSLSKGDFIVVLETNQTTDLFGPGTMSDSLGDTWHTFFAPNSPNGYALFWTVANANAAAGTYTVTNTIAQCIAPLRFSVPSAPSQDVFSTATNLGGASSLGTGSITTTTPNEILISFSTVDDATNRLEFTSQGSTWSSMGLTCGGHDASVFGGLQLQVATGSYSNLFTWNATMPITASIAAFKFAPSGQAPQINVLSRVESPKEWRNLGILR